MPEGHSIHRFAKQHNRMLRGQMVHVSSPQGRFADGAAAVDGRTLDRVEPLGKHLFYHLSGRSGDDAIHVHLGMYGKFRSHRLKPSEPLPEPRGAVRMRLVGDTHVLDLNGPTACEVLDADGAAAVRARIGPDLLVKGYDRVAVHARILRSRAGIGTLLMDQSVVGGIGNIYRSELLYRARIDPRSPGSALDADTLDALLDDATALMKVGVAHGPIRTVEPAHFGKEKWTQLRGDQRFWIYKRERCRGCGGPVERFQMASRNVFVCTAEQQRLP